MEAPKTGLRSFKGKGQHDRLSSKSGPHTCVRREEPVIDYGNQARVTYERQLGQDRPPNNNEVASSNIGVARPSKPLTETDLKTLLYDARLRNLESDKDYFVPRGSLLTICTYTNVWDVLRFHASFALDETEAEACAQYVCGHPDSAQTDAKVCARQIFATLVYVGGLSLISDFRKAEIFDNDLPFLWDDTKTKLQRRNSTSPTNIHFPDDAPWLASEFFSKQWWFHVPDIIGSTKKDTPFAQDYKLHEETILPLIEKKKAGQGAHGKVFCVRIHKDQHNLGSKPDRNEYLALKYVSLEERFEVEFRAYITNVKSNHVVELLATLRRGKDYIFVIPWAAKGSLKDLMERDIDFLPSAEEGSGEALQSRVEFTKWIHKQCSGLVEGLDRIHYSCTNATDGRLQAGDEMKYGLHLDIKPENILHFADDTSSRPFGTLKLADFGLLHYHGPNSRSIYVKGPGIPNQTYVAPEFQSKGWRSRNIDIWALGCVFSEFLTWAIEGAQSVKDFNKKRYQEPRNDLQGKERSVSWKDDKFFIQHPKPHAPASPGPSKLPTEVLINESPLLGYPEIKESVVKWITDLMRAAGRGSTTTFLQDFLEQVLSQMLVVDYKKRTTCKKLLEFFDKCSKKNEGHEDYWLLSSGSLTDKSNGGTKANSRNLDVLCENDSVEGQLNQTDKSSGEPHNAVGSVESGATEPEMYREQAEPKGREPEGQDQFLLCNACLIPFSRPLGWIKSSRVRESFRGGKSG